MPDVVATGCVIAVSSDTSKLHAAGVLREAGRVAEADLLLLSLGQDGTGQPCVRQPIRIVRGMVTLWPPPRLVTPVEQEHRTVEVVTEFEAVSCESWSLLTDPQRAEAERLVAAIHAVHVEVAQSPAKVRIQFWQTLPDDLDPASYPGVAMDWLAAARQDVSELS